MYHMKDFLSISYEDFSYVSYGRCVCMQPMGVNTFSVEELHVVDFDMSSLEEFLCVPCEILY